MRLHCISRLSERGEAGISSQRAGLSAELPLPAATANRFANHKKSSSLSMRPDGVVPSTTRPPDYQTTRPLEAATARNFHDGANRRKLLDHVGVDASSSR